MMYDRVDMVDKDLVALSSFRRNCSFRQSSHRCLSFNFYKALFKFGFCHCLSSLFRCSCKSAGSLRTRRSDSFGNKTLDSYDGAILNKTNHKQLVQGREEAGRQASR
ncbi:hypothetical protein M413DRAFT_442222 [Hebeloma cylindrosporum]|uniref:Uncharacterized protein n=1 Tax=Hebeloma cylindrosporum TaxID=76867 RepID=A0A0C2Y6T1_HEBCY|nr:hypothetical protein M413DRAFT_442222 [Hebeloma cylindrosporum h7]